MLRSEAFILTAILRLATVKRHRKSSLNVAQVAAGPCVGQVVFRRNRSTVSKGE